MTMSIRYLAVGYITIMLVMASAVAEEVKIMGLTEKNAALLDGNKSLEYLTGSCQKKKSHMKCHLNHIEVKKIDTTPLEEKAREVIANAKNDPQSLEHFIASNMPQICHEQDSIKAMLDDTPQSNKISRGERELRQATWQFCAERSEENLRAMFDMRLKMQSRTCSVWVHSYEQKFYLHGKEWMSKSGPYGECGVIDTAVFSNTLSNSKGQETHFNRYRTRQIMTRNNPPLCQQVHEKEYLFVLEKPWYVDCEYIDFSPLTFGWNFWTPSSP
jgi:hypothetical protein